MHCSVVDVLPAWSRRTTPPSLVRLFTVTVLDDINPLTFWQRSFLAMKIFWRLLFFARSANLLTGLYILAFVISFFF